MTALEYGASLFLESNPNPDAVSIEVGVYLGHTIEKLRSQLPNSIPIYGLDSFEGLPHDWEGTVCKKGQFTTDGVIPDVPGVQFIKGWFEETIPQLAYLLEHKPIGLLHLDCDLYSSTKTVLEGLNQNIVPGTIIVCDEWTYNFEEKKDDHEQRAVREWAVSHNRTVVKIDYTDPTVDEASQRHVGMERAVLVVLR